MVEHDEFLGEAIKKVELAIVKSMGGNKGHYAHISSTDKFYDYEWKDYANAKQELLEYIALTIENNWTNEVGIIVTHGIKPVIVPAPARKRRVGFLFGKR